MKRKAHYLQMVASGAWPAKIIVGHASLVREPLNGHHNCAIDKLVSWKICEIRFVADKLHVATRDNGDTAKGMFDAISSYLVRRKTTLLYLPKAYRVLTACGFWDMIELGDWCICEQPENDDLRNGEKRSRGWSGTVTTSPRCTIICCRVSNSPGTVRIVDTGNFGLEITNEPSNLTAGFTRAVRWAISWHEMLRSNQLGAPQNTVASQAMRAFRSKYIDTPILVHDNMPALGLERDSIHAGRCECFTLGQVPGEVYQLDASSHYAAVAKDADIPCRLRAYVEKWNNNVSPAERPLERMIAEVDIVTPDAFYPVSFDGDIVYPVGTFKTVLCGPELVLANNEGHIRKIHRASIYDMDRPFTQFYASLWKARQESVKASNADLSGSIKAMLSRFHGKFSQRAMSWVNVGNVDAPACFAQWYAPIPNNLDSCLQPGQNPIEPWHIDQYINQPLVAWRSIGWQTQVEVNAGEHRNSCPAIASWILSLGRVRLLQWMLSAGAANIHYIDTDSLWTNREGYARLLGAGHINGGELGYLRLVGVHKHMYIDGLKTYTADGVATHGGIPDHATISESGSHRYYVQPGIESALHRRHLPTAASFLVERRGQGRYRHGTPTLSGRVMPLTAPFALERRNVNSHPISCSCSKCKPR